MLSDLRYALRLLFKSRTFTIIAVLTLAVGIGSATVIFSAVNALFLKPVPFIREPARLVYITQTDTRRGNDDIGLNYRDVEDLRARTTTLESIWVHTDRTVIIAGSAEPERLLGTDISADGFEAMGVQPFLGRNFNPEDALAANPQVALLSYGLWQRRFGGAEDVIGSTISINNVTTTIIGVMPSGWGYPDYTDLWTPLRATDEKFTERGSYWLSGRARLKPGATLREAQAEASAIMAALAVENPVTNEGVGVRLVDIRAEAVHEASESTKLLFGAVLFVFLISCLNVANLLLARAYSRNKEIALRLALGADRTRLIRQLLTESLALGIMGGVAGLVLALWGLDLMVATIPIELPFWLRFDFDFRVFFFALALALLAAVLFGLVPAYRSTRPSLINELKEGGRTTGDDSSQTHRLRNMLVIAEVAIALILLVGATLLLKSFHNLRDLDPGFTRKGVLTFRTGFPTNMAAPGDENVRQFFLDVETRLASLPGVRGVGITDEYLARHSPSMSGIQIEGTAEPRSFAEMEVANHSVVSLRFFATLDVRLLAGRNFNGEDHEKANLAAIVDRSFALAHFGSVDAALGKRFRMVVEKGPEKPWMTVVGVVGDMVLKPDAKNRVPAYFTPLAQSNSNFMTLVLRTDGDPATYSEQVRQEVLAVNRTIPVYDVLTLEDVFIRSIWTRQFFSHLFTLAGAIALFLACIGIYGVMTYNVAQRSQELGVRMALGAQPKAVIALVLQHGAKLVCSGLAVGLLGAYFAVQLLSGTLYGVSPHDPPTFAFVPLLLITVGMIACYLPSRRITSIDPNLALRNE